MSWLVLVSGCGPLERPSDLGPAVLALYLGNDTELLERAELRSGTAVVFATEVHSEGFGPRDALRGAFVEVETDGIMVGASALSPGAYVTAPREARNLAPTDHVAVSVTHRGRSLALEGPVAPVLRLPLSAYVGAAGEDLEIELPTRWWRTYPHVVHQVLDAEGTVVWTDRPLDLTAWIERLSDPPRPQVLRIPGEALTPGPHLLASCFLQQMDAELVFDGPINEPFSGLWAGTAWLVPLEVRP